MTFNEKANAYKTMRQRVETAWNVYASMREAIDLYEDSVLLNREERDLISAWRSVAYDAYKRWDALRAEFDEQY